MHIDEEVDHTRQVQEFLDHETIANDEHLHLIVQNSFEQAITILETQKIDLVILDVRLGPVDLGSGPGNAEDEAGVRVLREIQSRRFVPIIFYTALPEEVRHLRSPLIRIVSKGDARPLQLLLTEIEDLFSMPFPAVNRALIHHLDRVQSDYLWKFVSDHWDLFGTITDHSEIAYLLGRRLAISLSQSGIGQLIREIQDEAPGNIADDNTIHPSRIYLIPPVEKEPLSGDLYRKRERDRDIYYILITPSCDFVKHNGRIKAERVLLASCVPLRVQPEFEAFLARDNEGDIKSLIKNRRKAAQDDRFYYLPSAFGLPDQIVDFQQLNNIPFADLEAMERIASLDSPFSEAFLSLFARYYGRIGTPDLDVNCIIDRLRLERTGIQ
jgi:CheY-like chemotaxis protein